MTSSSGFGLAVCMAEGCMAEGRGFVERIDPHGSVAQWNSAVAPEMQVSLGDRIEGFKVKGQGFKKLVNGNEFLHVKSRALVLQFTKPVMYYVKGKAPYGVGMLRKRNSDSLFFVVSRIRNSGCIKQWNKEFPDMQVSIGDVIREVNG